MLSASQTYKGSAVENPYSSDPNNNEPISSTWLTRIVAIEWLIAVILAGSSLAILLKIISSYR